jgi:mannosyltransferase OCH1-like enzyme
MNTWHKHMPDYLFVKWDEKNCDFINAPLFVKDAFKAKKYAFVSDYFRTKALYEQG